MQSKFDKIILCSTCRNNGLSRNENGFICSSCKTEYPDYEGIPAIIAPQDRRKQYGKLLVLADNTDRWKREAKWDSQIEKLIPDGEGFFLDYACGGGRREWVESKGYDYIGLDYYLDYGVNLLANGMNIPLKDNTISVCTSIVTMEHLSDPWQANQEIFRVLKPGGLYVGSAAFLYAFHERSYYHMTHLGLSHLLEKSGFFIEELIPFKKSGFDSLARSLFIIKQPTSFVVSSIFEITMFLRKIGAKLASKIYAKDKMKSMRINEFLGEEKMRFAAGFIFAARKPKNL